MWIFNGDVNEVGDVGKCPGKSFLFSLTSYDLEIGLSGAKVRWRVERASATDTSGAHLTALENPTECISLTPGRTHNRSRSPR
jgi:hypothetical protein